MSTMTSIVPSEVDINLLPSRKIGELLCSRNDGIVYLVIYDEATNSKKIVPIKGQASFKVAQLLRHFNVISDTAPSDKIQEYVGTWYYTPMKFVRPTGNVEDAFITAKVENVEGKEVNGTVPPYLWVKILPYSQAKNIAIETNSDNPKTLFDYLNETENYYTFKVQPANGGVYGYEAKDPRNAQAFAKRQEELKKSPINDGELTIKTVGSERVLCITDHKNTSVDLIKADIDASTRSLIENMIQLGNRPINYHDNTMWYADMTTPSPTSNALLNARQLFLQTVKNGYKSKAYGLKWRVLNVSTNKLFLSGNDKILTVPTNGVPAEDSRVVAITNIDSPRYRYDTENNITPIPNPDGFDKGLTTYFEVTVDQDKENQVNFVFTYSQFEDENVNKSILADLSNKALIISKDRYYGATFIGTNVDVPIPYTKLNALNESDATFDKKTFFFYVKKNAGDDTTLISFGTVIQEAGRRIHSFIVGNEEMDEASCIKAYAVRNFGVLVEKNGSATVDSLPVEVSIKPHIGRPTLDSTPVNLELPNENPYIHTVLATNANSVFLTGKDGNATTLDTLLDRGRVIMALRNYSETNNGLEAKAGELLIEKLPDIINKKGDHAYQLRFATADGNTVKVVGKNENTFIKHLENSVKVANNDIEDLTIDPDDKSIVYYNQRFYDPANVELVRNNVLSERHADKLIFANPVITVKGVDENGEEYYKLKTVVPNTITDKVFYKTGNTANSYEKLTTTLDRYNTLFRELQNSVNVYTDFDQMLKESSVSGEAQPTANYLENVELYFTKHQGENIRELALLYDMSKFMTPNSTFVGEISKELNTKGNKLQHILGLKNDEGMVTITKGNAEMGYPPMYVTIHGKDNINKSAVFKYDGGSYVTDKWIISPVRFKNTDNKLVDEVDILTVNDTLNTKKDAILDSNTTITNLVLDGNKTQATDTVKSSKGVLVKDRKITNDDTPFKLITYTGSQVPGQPSTLNTKITIGDGDSISDPKVIKDITLSSANVPSWSDRVGNKWQILTRKDLNGVFEFKKKLYDGDRVVNLNTLAGVENVGYYTYAHDKTISLKDKNFPAKIMDTGNMVLEVYATETETNDDTHFFTEKVLLQRLTHYIANNDRSADINEVEVYERVEKQEEGTFTPWVKVSSTRMNTNKDTVSISDNDQTVTGSVTFNKLTAKNPALSGLTLLREGIVNSNRVGAIKTKANLVDSVTGIPDPDNNEQEFNLLTIDNEKKLVFGDVLKSATFSLEPNARPSVTYKGTDGDTVKELAFKEEIENINNTMTPMATFNTFKNTVVEDYATKAQLNNLTLTSIKGSEDSLFYKNIKAGANEAKDSFGTITIGADNTEDNKNNNITFNNNAKLKLPTYASTSDTETSFDTKPIEDFNNNIRYDVINSGEGILTTSVNSSIMNTKPTSTVATSLQIKSKKDVDSNKSSHYIRNIFGEATRGEYSEIITTNRVITDITTENNSDNVVPAYKLLKNLSDASVKNRGNLPAFTNAMTSDAEKGTFLTGLPAGQYNVATAEDAKKLGLNTDKIKVPVILFLYDKIKDGNNKDIRKVEALSSDGSKISTGIAHPDNGVTWNTSDLNLDSTFSKEKLEEKFKTVEDKLNDFTTSMDYTNLNTETNVGVNRIAKTLYITPENNRKRIQFTSNSTELGKITAIGNGNVIIQIKGATGYAYPIDLTLTVAIIGDKVETNFMNAVAGSTIVVYDFNYNKTTKTITFGLKDQSGYDTLNTGMNIFVQMFGEKLAQVKDMRFDHNFVD